MLITVKLIWTRSGGKVRTGFIWFIVTVSGMFFWTLSSSTKGGTFLDYFSDYYIFKDTSPWGCLLCFEGSGSAVICFSFRSLRWKAGRVFSIVHNRLFYIFCYQNQNAAWRFYLFCLSVYFITVYLMTLSRTIQCRRVACERKRSWLNWGLPRGLPGASERNHKASHSPSCTRSEFKSEELLLKLTCSEITQNVQEFFFGGGKG
jgi:hypothetical protein